MKQTDFLVVGSGIAGLSSAILLSHLGEVTVLTKGKLKQANTYWAQGGIAAVMRPEDSFNSHIEDTLRTGAGFCDEAAVRFMVEHGPAAIRFMEDIGIHFNDEPAHEAGHSHPRVWRTSDFTGQDILNALIKAVKKIKSIRLMEDSEVVELIVHEGRCRGAFVRSEGAQATEALLARQTILATGGLGQLYLKTTNTLGSGGDGLAIAIKAGLAMKDLEFIQFHPTALDRPDEGRYFLLSETLRGAGAKILNHKGHSFLQQFDPRGELAPRDLVSRAIFFEQMNGPVFLDLRYLDKKMLRKRFPNILKRLKAYGFDFSKDQLPITPVAHYSCGGVPVDLNAQTEMPGLCAVGEVARTGVHGANRLASNSLLEAVVFSQAMATHAERAASQEISPEIPESALTPPALPMEDIAQVKAYAQRIRQLMWDYAGIVRTPENLKKAIPEIMAIPARDYRIQHRQLVCVKIIEACLARPDSAGTHTMMPDMG